MFQIYVSPFDEPDRFLFVLFDFGIILHFLKK